MKLYYIGGSRRSRRCSVPLNSGDLFLLFFPHGKKTRPNRGWALSPLFRLVFFRRRGGLWPSLLLFFCFLATSKTLNISTTTKPKTFVCSFSVLRKRMVGKRKKNKTPSKTRDGGYLGSHIDEERSKMRYVV